MNLAAPRAAAPGLILKVKGGAFMAGVCPVHLRAARWRHEREDPLRKRGVVHLSCGFPLLIFEKISAPSLPVHHHKGEGKDEHTAASEYSDDRYPFRPRFIEGVVIRRKTE